METLNKSWNTAITFAEAGEFETALEYIPNTKTNTISNLFKHVSGVLGKFIKFNIFRNGDVSA